MKSFLPATILLAWLLLIFYLVSSATTQAQGRMNGTTEISNPKKGTRIWSGTGKLQLQTFYWFKKINDSTELDKETQSALNLQIRHFWFTGPAFGIGLEGFGQFYMDGFLKNLALGSGGVGPLVRYYPFQQILDLRWQPYLQTGALAGYDLALGDSVGAISGEGFRLRSSLAGGITWRLSNAVGIYLEAGHAWEGEGFTSPDARAWQMEFGMQIFRF